jgi:phosphate-selective porin OprO/OprP
VLVSTWGKNWSFAGGYFDDNLADRRNKNDGSHSLAMRGTYNPIDTKDFKIHLGASAVFRNLDANQTVSFSTRPESHPTDARLLSTGTLRDVEDIETFGLEAALIKGPWLLQAEAVRAKLDRTTRPDPTFDGAYIQASWIVTGERQRYSGKSGVLKQIKPNSPYGAIELAIRYSTLDLEEKTVTGGEEDNLTLGINWHINQNMRIMANYINVDAEPNRNGVVEDVDIMQMRFQAYF